MPNKDETEVLDGLDEDTEENVPYKYSITSYGADYPVDSLIRRIKDGSILVPQFQRNYVWELSHLPMTEVSITFLTSQTTPG